MENNGFLAWNGENWEMVEIEEGDTTAQHYGLAVDLGSTTVVARLLDCNSGEILKEVSCFNKQIQWGTDILSRIFYCKDNRKSWKKCGGLRWNPFVNAWISWMQATRALHGNRGQHHHDSLPSWNGRLLRFYTPHAVHADRPGFQLARDLDIPLKGYVYCYPAKSNYLGGDIISGMIDTELYKKNEISVFFDIGTNGELVIGNKEFLLCGAGAAGPALEGGVVRTGMRADIGAVDEVKIRDGNIFVPCNWKFCASGESAVPAS